MRTHGSDPTLDSFNDGSDSPDLRAKRVRSAPMDAVAPPSGGGVAEKPLSGEASRRGPRR